MKTSLVIASVLLAGVALEAAAFRINNNENQGDSQKQWARYQQGESYDGSSVSAFEQNGDQFQNTENVGQYKQKLNRYNYNNENRDQYNQQLNHNNYNNENRDRYNQKLNHNTYNGENREQYKQYNQQLNHNDYNNENRDQRIQRLNHNNYDDFDSTEQRRYQSQNQVTVIDRSAGLTRKIVEKVAAFQKIARDNNIAQRTEYFDGALNLNKNVIKLSEQNFVNFYNTTMKHLNNGELEYLYINPERDTVLAQYHFDQVEAVGSFKSNVRGANSGYYTVAMNNVNCNVTTGFNNDQHADIRPAQFWFADTSLRTEDGAETQVFNGALEHTYLGALKKAVSAEVAKSVSRGMIAQMKYEIRKPAVFYSAEKKGKLYDMRWKEDDVSMEMSNVGFQNPEIVAEPMQFSSALFYRKSENVYRMRYHFTLNNLAWTSPLTVESAGKKMTVRSADFNADEVNVFVTVDKPYGQQQSCGQFNTNVEVIGLRYNFNESVQSEFMTKVENRLQRYIEHSLEKYVQESLKQELCHSDMQ